MMRVNKIEGLNYCQGDVVELEEYILSYCNHYLSLYLHLGFERVFYCWIRSCLLRILSHANHNYRNLQDQVPSYFQNFS